MYKIQLRVVITRANTNCYCVLHINGKCRTKIKLWAQMFMAYPWAIAPGRCGRNFKSVTSEHILRITSSALLAKLLGVECHRIPLIINKSTLVQVMTKLLPPGNRPLPEPMLARMCGVIWRHSPTMGLTFGEKRLHYKQTQAKYI